MVYGHEQMARMLPKAIDPGGMDPQPPGPHGNQKPFQIIPSPFATSNPAAPTLSSIRTAPHRNVKPLFRISTTYSTIAARATSFQRQLLTRITPHQLAQNGFYHQVRAGVGDVACCFTCETEIPLKIFQEHSIGDLPKIHSEDCLWQVICHDLNPFVPTLPYVPPSTDLSTQCAVPESHTQPDPRPTPTAPPPASHAEPNLESPADPQSIEPESGPPVSRPATCPSQTFQPTPAPTTTARQCQQQTYASVLQQPTTSTPNPSSKPHQSATQKKVLTIEDLHRRFHNKPSPFEREEKTHKRPKTKSAAQSLSKFLRSALPAFSRFLVEMQPDSDISRPPHQRTHYSRATWAA